MDWATDAFNEAERQRDKWEASLPVCDMCGEPIGDDWLYVIDGYTYCENCVESCRKENNGDV